MLFEVDGETRDFITIYDKDYYPKPRTTVTKYIPASSLGTCSDFYKNVYNTVYHLDFSRSPDNYSSLYKKQTGMGVSCLRLPDNWVIPETVQRKSYRKPREIMTPESSGLPGKIKKPSNNLDPNMEQRKILNVKTGDSEYFTSICSTGERIIRENILQGIKSHKASRTIKHSDSS